MDQIAAALIVKALDGLHQRALFAAQNIANANTPDYQPVRVAFEDDLRVAADRGLDAIRAVRATPVTTEATSEPMRLDLELAAASQTAMRYRALIDILGRQMSLSRAAARLTP